MLTEKLSETNETIEILEGVDYGLCPCNEDGAKLRAGSIARLSVSRANCYVPRGEFHLVSGGKRYRLKISGGIYWTCVFRTSKSREKDGSERRAYFWPVRVLAIEETASSPETSSWRPSSSVPLFAGRLTPRFRGGSILGDGVAKFQPKEPVPEGWTPGDHIRIVSGRLIYTALVERHLPRKDVPRHSGLIRSGRRGDRWTVTASHTIRETVIVRILAIEIADATEP